MVFKCSKWVLLFIVFVVFIGFNALSEEPEIGSQVGQKILDFNLPLLDGEKLNLYEQFEQYDVVLLYFFFAAT